MGHRPETWERNGHGMKHASYVTQKLGTVTKGKILIILPTVGLTIVIPCFFFIVISKA